MKFKNPIILQLNQKYQLISSLNQLLALSGWDLETYMPQNGASNRGLVSAKVSSLIQKLYLDKDFVKLVEEASKQTDLNDYELGILRLLKKNLYNFFKLPPEFVKEYAKVTNEGMVAWREAKDKNRYDIFSPFLKKIIDLSIKQAEYLGYDNHPYDALLDNYEEDLKTSDVEKYFESIKPTLVEVLKYIKQSKKYTSRIHPLEKETYNEAELEKLNYKVLEHFNYDKNNLRLDRSAHPFSQGINTKDVRITTRYLGRDFGATISGTIHEFGHALYDMQTDDSFDFTPISNAVSLVLHESQSRFWENMVGRNLEFLRVMLPKIKRLGDNYKNYSLTDYYRYFNKVKPSLIRVKADEVTYHFHIMIRFEIEKMMIERKVDVKDLPEIWNSKYREYLGIKPKNYGEGILQDIHWSMGAIGYFPTYSMGTVLSAFWAKKIEEEVGNISKLVKTSEGIKKIQKWLKENVHQYGPTYTVKDLLKKKFNTEFSVEYWKEYIREKYMELY